MYGRSRSMQGPVHTGTPHCAAVSPRITSLHLGPGIYNAKFWVSYIHTKVGLDLHSRGT
jgi:hypothetical protein